MTCASLSKTFGRGNTRARRPLLWSTLSLHCVLPCCYFPLPEKKGSMALMVWVKETATLPRLTLVSALPSVCTSASGAMLWICGSRAGASSSACMKAGCSGAGGWQLCCRSQHIQFEMTATLLGTQQGAVQCSTARHSTAGGGWRTVPSLNSGALCSPSSHMVIASVLPTPNCSGGKRGGRVGRAGLKRQRDWARLAAGWVARVAAGALFVMVVAIAPSGSTSALILAAHLERRAGEGEGEDLQNLLVVAAGRAAGKVGGRELDHNGARADSEQQGEKQGQRSARGLASPRKSTEQLTC